MKRLIIAMLMICLIVPIFASAQEQPIQPVIPTSWSVTPNRSIIWIGEDLIILVNGTGNASYCIEMRALGTNNTVLNATFTEWRVTSINGTDWAVIAAEYNEEPGNYRVQVLVNQMVVAYSDVRLEFSFERWVGIQIKKLLDYDIKQDAAIQEGVERDSLIVKKLNHVELVNNVLVILVLVMAGLSIPAWLDIYRKNCETKGNRSKLLDALSGVEEDRTLYYGGVDIEKEDIIMYGGKNVCKNKTLQNHNVDNCPHCQLDIYADKLGLGGKTHAEIVEYVGGGKRAKKIETDKPGYFTRKAMWNKYQSKKKDVKK